MRPQLRFCLMVIAFVLGGRMSQVSAQDWAVKTNILSDKRYQGYAYGAGVAYGYAFMLSKTINLELEVGFGYAYLNYDIFNCSGCGRKVASDNHHYVGPTKAAVNLVFVF